MQMFDLYILFDLEWCLMTCCLFYIVYFVIPYVYYTCFYFLAKQSMSENLSDAVQRLRWSQ
jgi:hypothetical protein